MEMASNPPMSRQQACTKALLNATAPGAINGKEQWEQFRAQSSVERIIIADANFDQRDLRGFDLSRCWIGRSSFFEADLREASFVQSIFRQCTATNANIEGAKFRDADMFGDGLALLTDRYDDTTDFEVPLDKLPDELSSGLLDAAHRARSKRFWRYRKSRSLSVRVLLWLTDYGFSLKRLSWIGVVVVLAFWAIFIAAGQSIQQAALASISYFLSLSDPLNEMAVLSFVGAFEALLGMLFFAVLTTVLVSMFFDKN
jgi:hypothetical protein